MTENGAATLETREDAGEGKKGLVKLWMQAIELAGKDESNWRKAVEKTAERYRDEKEERSGSQFNILYSSTATLAPALYNSTPAPNVQRRFRDRDPVAAKGAQVLERALVYGLDCADFDGCMTDTVFDSVLAGRGVARVRYLPRQLPATKDEQGKEIPGEVGYEDLGFEYVKWRDFRRGPGRRWDDVPWIAFQHRITREQATKLNPTLGPKINLDYVQEGADQDGEPADIFKRAIVWEVWDKEKRKVLFLAPSYHDEPLAIEDPFCNFKGFFPVPKPLYDIKDTNSLVPKVPYSVYEDQAKELDTLTARISALTKVLKWRGYRGHIENWPDLATADDGDLLPITDFRQFDQAGGLEKMIWLMPIERLVLVIRELVSQREQVKQTIFDLTGVADIMRGQTNPNETLGAQQIKAQWGSIRLQDRQKEVQRFARDMVRLAAEIVAEKFSAETLMVMTGIDMPLAAPPAMAMGMGPMPLGNAAMMGGAAMAAPQAGGAAGAPMMPGAMPMPQMPPQVPGTAPEKVPTWEAVTKLLKSDASRRFRIDIETDSTIEADKLATQKAMSEFVTGFGSFINSIGPAVQQGAMPIDVAVKILSAFCRNFHLGRAAEDALDSLEDMPAKPQQKPDPAAAEAAKAQAQTQADDAKHQRTLQADAQRHERELNFKATEADKDRELKAHLAGVPPMVPGSAQGAVQAMADQMQQLLLLIGQMATQQQQTNAAMMAQFAALQQAAAAPKELTVTQRGAGGQIEKVMATPQVAATAH